MSSTKVIVSAMCSSILLVSLAAAVLQRASAAEAGAAGRGGILHIPSAAELALAGCPSTCGGYVDILYPFGIGPGCFREGFELTCDDSVNPPMLFLGNSTVQVEGLYPKDNTVQAPGIHFNFTMVSGMDTYNMSWEAPVKGVTVNGRSSFLHIVGCGVGAYLFGNDTNDPIGSCMSICLDDKEAMKKANADHSGEGHGMGSCSIRLGLDVRAFGFVVGHLNGGVSAGDVLSNVKVFLAEDYRFDTSDIYSSQIDESHIRGASFKLAITDQPSCEIAQKNKATYACSYKSDCQNLSSGGYSCWCPGVSAAQEDNPYVMGGCGQGYNPIPKAGCKRVCGDMSVPFPFGLEKGCYALNKFRLNCTSENIIIHDQGVEYTVANVLVNEGYLSVRDKQNNSKHNDEQVTVRTATVHEYPAAQDIPLEDLLYLSEDFYMKMWWSVENLTCSEAMSKQRRGMYACRSVNSTCVSVTYGRGNTMMQLGYRCECSQGFEGNPYMSDGCLGKNSLSVQIVINRQQHT